MLEWTVATWINSKPSQLSMPLLLPDGEVVRVSHHALAISRLVSTYFISIVHVVFLFLLFHRAPEYHHIFAKSIRHGEVCHNSFIKGMDDDPKVNVDPCRDMFYHSLLTFYM